MEMRKILIPAVILTVSAYADINGIVYKDFNFNGKKDGGDAPVIGAIVKATCSDGTSKNVKTDNNGHYTINGFAAGSKCRIEVDPSNAGVGS